MKGVFFVQATANAQVAESMSMQILSGSHHPHPFVSEQVMQSWIWLQ
jgi:hypothetical protein